MVSSLSSRNRDTESSLSSNNQVNSDGTTGFKSKITKNDCKSAFDLKDTEDLGPYNWQKFIKLTVPKNKRRDTLKTPSPIFHNLKHQKTDFFGK